MKNNIYRKSGDKRFFSQPDNGKDELAVGYPYNIQGNMVITDHTLLETDFCLVVDASAGDIDITVPTASTITTKPRDWRIKRYDNSSNRVRVMLQTASDSMFGSNYSAALLDTQGQGMAITLFNNNKYAFSDWSGTTIDLPVAKVQTNSVSETAGTLSMEGDLTDLGAFDDMDVSFEYLDITAGDVARTGTTPVNQAATGTFSDTVSVTTGNKIKIRAKAQNGTTIIYGAEKQVNGPIYLSVADAISDGMVLYLPMQETAGTNTQADDVIAGNHATAFNGVTISSDTIGGNTIYKRVFGANDYLESPYIPALSSGDWTVGIQTEIRGSSGDHSIWHLGTNTLSLAGDGTSLQQSVNGTIANAGGQLPTGSVNDYYTVVTGGNTETYESTATTDTLRNTQSVTPSSDGTYTRIARGAAGDSNQQDNEYLNNGDIRSFFIMNRALSSSERQAFSKCMASGFLLIEGI